MKHYRLAPLLAFAFALAVTHSPVAAANDKELRVGYPVDIATLDPANHRDRWTEIVLRHLYDGLLTRDPLMRLIPDMAASWTQINPTLYAFTLRDGIRFQSGRSLEADDVVFSFERLINRDVLGQVSPRARLLGPLKSVRAIDRQLVHFELSEPWPIFPAMIPFQQIIERPEQSDSDGQGIALVGSGPFRLVERFPGSAVVFRRNENYFGGSGEIPPVGQACVSRLVFNVVPNNESRVAGLLAGDFDLVVDILPHSIPVIARHPDTEIVSVAGTRSFYIVMDNAVPPFDNPNVREAVALALDRKALVSEHLDGKATLIDGILSPFATGKNLDLERNQHNPERALRLLSEAGLQDGLALELDTNRQLFPLAESIALQLAEIGISVKTVVASSTEIADQWHKPAANRRDRLWLRSWGNASLDPVGIFDPTHKTGGRGNFANYTNADLDALLEEAGREQNFARRAQLYRRAEAIVNADLPYIYLWVPKDIYGVSNRVRGFTAAPDGRLNLQDVCIEEPR